MDSFIKEAFTLLAIGVTIVALRTYARWSLVGVRNFMLDDYLMILAVVSNSRYPATWATREIAHGDDK